LDTSVDTCCLDPGILGEKPSSERYGRGCCVAERLAMKGGLGLDGRHDLFGPEAMGDISPMGPIFGSETQRWAQANWFISHDGEMKERVDGQRFRG
jgi:hypothetical protein